MSNPNPTTEYRQDCYHEAAHAVFYHHAGLTIQSIQVSGMSGGLGLTCTIEHPNTPSPHQAVNIAAGDLAAWYAGLKYQGQKDVKCMPFGDFLGEAEFGATAGVGNLVQDLSDIMPEEFEDDFAGALKLLEQAKGSPESPWKGLEECYREVCEVIERGLVVWWPQIQAVAEELIKTTYLDGTSVVRLIEEQDQSRLT